MSSTAPSQQCERENISANALQRGSQLSDESSVDQRPMAITQRRLQESANNSVQARQLRSVKDLMKSSVSARFAQKPMPLQCKKIGELSTEQDEDRQKAIVAAFIAQRTGQEIAESVNSQKALDTLHCVGWQNEDIDDRLFGIIDTFLQHSPEYHIPTTPAIWRGFIERIVYARGQLELPGVDLVPQPRSERADKYRENVISNVNLKVSKLPAKQVNQGRVQQLYKRIMEANITINFALDKLFKYGVPRILNAFEVKELGHQTNNIHGKLEQERLAAEEHHFGMASGLPDSEVVDQPVVEPRLRPRYAAINYKNHPYGAAARNDYGLSHMVLSKGIRPFCTITIGDSFDVMGTDVDGAFPYTESGVLKLAETVVGEMSAEEFESMAAYKAGDGYLDVQIHADVDLREHVDAIYVSTVEMAVFDLDIGTVDKLIRNLTGGVFVREA